MEIIFPVLGFPVQEGIEEISEFPLIIDAPFLLLQPYQDPGRFPVGGNDIADVERVVEGNGLEALEFSGIVRDFRDELGDDQLTVAASKVVDIGYGDDIDYIGKLGQAAAQIGYLMERFGLKDGCCLKGDNYKLIVFEPVLEALVGQPEGVVLAVPHLHRVFDPQGLCDLVVPDPYPPDRPGEEGRGEGNAQQVQQPMAEEMVDESSQQVANKVFL